MATGNFFADIVLYLRRNLISEKKLYIGVCARHQVTISFQMTHISVINTTKRQKDVKIQRTKMRYTLYAFDTIHFARVRVHTSHSLPLVDIKVISPLVVSNLAGLRAISVISDTLPLCRKSLLYV